MKKKRGPVARARAAKRRRISSVTHDVRAYVFEREQGICRCCGYMAAESMHELKPRSLGGQISPENSIAVCGDGVRGCHGKLQRHEIAYRFASKRLGAEGMIAFKGLHTFPDTERASEPGSGRITCEWSEP